MDERRRQKKLERKRRKREDKRKAAAALRPQWQRIGEPESWLTPSLASRLASPKMSDTLVAFARNALDSPHHGHECSRALLKRKKRFPLRGEYRGQAH